MIAIIHYDLNVGFSRIEINPPLGVNLTGYFKVRLAEGILDDTEINTVAVNKGEKTIILVALDGMSSEGEFCTSAREAVAKATGLDKGTVFIHVTHTHTGVTFAMESDLEFDSEKEYIAQVRRKIADSAVYAIQDLKPARMGIGFSKRNG